MQKNWYWIELIGFDCEAKDYGVDHFFDVTSGNIEGITFLFSNIDFVNLHDGITGKTLQPCDCSYGATLYSEERKRQPWTDVQLKGLVSELHKRGVKVTFSFFNLFTYGNDNGELTLGEFCKNHEELWDRGPKGDKIYGINVLKHLGDKLYEDYLFSQINRVISDYGFDGVHLADGISTFRPSVQNGDFSDDIVGQFMSFSGISLPERAESKKDYISRRKEIITKYYFRYLTFLSERWKSFYDKLYSTVNGIVILNNAWTCNPFEALYRYGFDYSKISSHKAFGVMLEDVSPTMPILSKADNAGYDSTDEDCAGYHYKYMLMQMACKTCMKNTNIMALTSVKDTTEQWDILRHSPMELARNIARRKNTYIFNGQYETCIEKPVFCLSNGLSKSDWTWLHSLFDNADRGGMEKVCGYTVVFSQNQIYREVESYIKERRLSSSEINYRLMLNGLDIGCMSDYQSIEMLNSPVIITNYHLLDEAERKTVARIKSPLVVMGEKVDLDGERIKAHFDIVIRNMPLYDGIKEDIKSLERHARIKKAAPSPDRIGGIWTAPLRYSSLPNAYYKALSKILSRLISLPVSPEGCHVTKQKISDGKYRYLISNDTHKYLLPEITCGGTPRSAVSVLKYRGYKVAVTPSSFIDRIPPRGMCIVETEE
ncbi:MAG: hypothetical protein IJO52_00390 [Clostridia bacterium]|nr:hypothetical protein [Clostridia bacterium]